MKILFVESYAHVFHGQQRTLSSLLEQCSTLGIEPTVAVTVEGEYTDILKNKGWRIIRFPYPELLNRYGGVLYRDGIGRRIEVLKQSCRYVLQIRSQLKSGGFNAIFCNDMRGILTVGMAAWLARVPVITWDKLDKPHGILDWFQLPFVKKNVIISNAVLNKYPKIQKSLFRKKIVRIPNGVDLSRFEEPSNIRSELGFFGHDVLAVMGGTITKRKAPDRILSILERLLERVPNLHVLLAGEPTDDEEGRDYYDALPHKDHPHVHFLGMRTDMPELLYSSDMLLIPSRHEGMGQITVEAMAANLPVVGAEAGGIPEVVVDGETGFIVEGDDSDAWVEAISKLAASAELRRKMGEAGRERVEKKFNRPVLMRQVLELCMSVAR